MLDRLEEVRSAISSAGVVVPGVAGQPRAHPLLNVEDQLRGELAGYWHRLGFDPGEDRYVRVNGATGRLGGEAG